MSGLTYLLHTQFKAITVQKFPYKYVKLGKAGYNKNLTEKARKKKRKEKKIQQ